MKFLIMVAVHNLIFGEMAGFKIVSYIATQVKKARSMSNQSMQYEKILHTVIQCKYMGTISKYIII